MDEPEIEYIDNDTTCGTCFAEFLDLEDLEIHKTQMHVIGILECQFCALKLRSIEDYAIHIRDTHLVNMKACQFCTRVFTDENYYRKHEKKHLLFHNKAKFSCSQCEMVFFNTKELETHEFNIHIEGDTTKGLWLRDCSPHLASVLNMNLKYVLSEGKRRFVCSKCRATSLSLDDYIQHLKNEKCRSLCCNTCSVVYKNKKSLAKHLSNRTECNYESKNFTKTCKECLKDFPVHFWRYHQRTCKVVKCQVCDIIFEDLDCLAKHQTEKHPLVISVQVCKYCKKEFVGKVGLEKHIERTHIIDQYKYKCVYCEMVFKHPQKLFAHFFVKHKEIEPYTCSMCNKKFKIRKNFTIHIKLEHNSVGSVEFDEKFHVYFREKKSSSHESITKDNAKEIDENNKENTEELKDGRPEETQENPEKNSGSAEKKLIEIEIQPEPNTDFLATETEAQTESEIKDTVKPKRKVKTTRVDDTIYSSGSDSSDDQPLMSLRYKKARKQGRSKRSRLTNTQLVKQRFTCQYCNKLCMTYQNYHHHLNTAHQNEEVKCVKCNQIFGSKMQLTAHIAKEHSSSKLTETLKKVLANRRNNNQTTSISDLNTTLTTSEKFQRTIRKVDCKSFEEPATLKSSELSVQKFIENFTPESNEIKKSIEINGNISIKTVECQQTSPFIKLTMFQAKNTDTNILRSNKLAMPVRFKPDKSERNSVTVKVVNAESRSPFIEQYENTDAYYDNDNYDHYEEVMEEKHNIPEVAQEVMLENSEEAPRQRVHKVVIPNIPKEMGQLRIATLQPEAPFYKIVKISEVLQKPAKENKEVEREITLPDGKKLVSVNPLAHLLGDTPIEKIIGERNNKYQSKTLDFEKAVAKALMNVKPPSKKRKFSKVEP